MCFCLATEKGIDAQLTALPQVDAEPQSVGLNAKRVSFYEQQNNKMTINK